MKHHSIASLASISILLPITLLLANHGISALSTDIVTESCRRCAKITPSLRYSFCLTSLQSVPISHFTDLRGLAIISMELALINATDTISTIKDIISGGSFDPNPFGLACLRKCLRLYRVATSALVDGIGAFMMGQFPSAGILVGGVMDRARKCEDGFEKKEGEVCPLKRENYDLFQLCDIALCITRILSLGPEESVL